MIDLKNAFLAAFKEGLTVFFRPSPASGKQLDKRACDMSERKNMPRLLVPDLDPAT
jgi:hypothetical protein